MSAKSPSIAWFLAGYVCAALTVVAVGVGAKAFSQSFAVLTVGSYHFDRTKDYNERNLGLGLEHRRGDFSVSAGFYRNSFDRHTNYLLGSYTPLDLVGWRTGVVVGGVTGYTDGVAPWITGIATRDFGRIGVNIVFSYAGVALQLKLKLGR